MTIQRMLEAGVPPIFGRARVAAGQTIKHGAFVVIDTTAASGRARELTYNAAYVFAGIADREADNSAGANDAETTRYRQQGHLQVKLADIAGADPEDVGDTVYATDEDMALTMTSTNAIPIGTLSFVDEITGDAGIFFQGVGVRSV